MRSGAEDFFVVFVPAFGESSGKSCAGAVLVFADERVTRLLSSSLGTGSEILRFAGISKMNWNPALVSKLV